MRGSNIFEVKPPLFYCGAMESRTPDLLNAIQVGLSQNRRLRYRIGRLRRDKISVVACCGNVRFRESPHRVIVGQLFLRQRLRPVPHAT